MSSASHDFAGATLEFPCPTQGCNALLELSAGRGVDGRIVSLTQHWWIMCPACGAILCRRGDDGWSLATDAELDILQRDPLWPKVREFQKRIRMQV